MPKALIYLLLFVALSAYAKGASPLEWRGYCQLEDGPLFSLTDAKSNQATWARIGQERFGFLLVRGDNSVLRVRDVASGSEIELRLVPATAKKGPHELPALSRADALSLLRTQLLGVRPKDIKVVPIAELPGGKEQLERHKAKHAKESADLNALLNANPDLRTPDAVVETVRTFGEMKGDIPLPAPASASEKRRETVFRKLTLDVLPPHIRANLTQEDLDSLLDAQRAMMTKVQQALEQHGKEPSSP
jgi:hypothetical protein